MTISFKDPEPEKTPSLAFREGLEGSLIFLHQSGGFWIAAEENDPELIEVRVAVKTRRTLVYDEVETESLRETFKRIHRIPVRVV